MTAPTPAEPRCPLTRQQIRAWKRHALKHPWPGNEILRDRRHVIDTTAILEPDRYVRLMLSFDVGYHGSGWFKNSDWEQNLHLSISHPLPDRPLLWAPGKPDLGLGPGMEMQLETVGDGEARAWGRAVFGAHAPMAWFEPAASTFDPYRAPNVVHLRLFYGRDMQPFIPEGEPYELKPWDDGTSPEKIFG
jgi:hypothetical protein